LSKTAIWVAAARAIGAHEPDVLVRNPDYLAEALLGDLTGLALDIPVVAWLGKPYETAMREPEVLHAVRATIVRTRFIDGALERAVANGVEQVLILGAGLDSRAYRFEALLAHIHVFEVDRPATQEFKRQRINTVLGVAPGNLFYVPLPAKWEGLAAALAEHGYDTERKTFVIMEGLSMYLEENALRAIFRFVAMHPHGSCIVFDIATPARVQEMNNLDVRNVPTSMRSQVERMANMFRDEPWLFGLPVNGEREFLAGIGLQLGETITIGGQVSTTRYLMHSDGTTVGARNIKHLTVPSRAPLEDALSRNAPSQPGTMAMRAQQNAGRMAEAYVPYPVV